MHISVRFSQGLAQAAGTPRTQVAMNEGATLSELYLLLGAQYPRLSSQLSKAVAVASGQIISPEEPLNAGQEVALLLPISGG